jgi:hypothetical protein
MRKALMIAIVAALPAAAQWRHFGEDRARLTGFFGVGGSAPLNPIARNLDTGWNITGGVGVTNSWIGVTFDAMYNDFGFNRRALYYSGAPAGGQKFWALTVDPIVHVNDRGPVDFYITGGGGLYGRVTDFRDYGGPFGDDLLARYTTYKPGVNGGAGFAFRVVPHSHVKIFAEARFHHMFTPGSGASFIPVTVGVRF